MNGRSSSTMPPQVSQLGQTPPPGRRLGLTEIWTGHSQTAAAIWQLNLATSTSGTIPADAAGAASRREQPPRPGG